MRAFIRQLPARESHWCRNKTQKRIYLDSCITIAGLYQEFVKQNPDSAEVIKEKKFYDIFSNEFNIGIGYPRSDLCDTCEKLTAAIEKAENKKRHEDEKKARNLKGATFASSRSVLQQNERNEAAEP